MFRKFSVKLHRALNSNSTSNGMWIHIVFTKMHLKQNPHNLSVKYPVMNGVLIPTLHSKKKSLVFCYHNCSNVL